MQQLFKRYNRWQPTPVLHGKFHGQKSLAGYSLWGRKESDTTERSQCSLFFNIKSLQNSENSPVRVKCVRNSLINDNPLTLQCPYIPKQQPQKAAQKQHTPQGLCETLALGMRPLARKLPLHQNLAFCIDRLLSTSTLLWFALLKQTCSFGG